MKVLISDNHAVSGLKGSENCAIVGIITQAGNNTKSLNIVGK